MKRTGTITQLGPHRFRARGPSGKGQQHIGVFPTRAEAKRALNAHLMTLADAVRHYEGLTVAKLGNRILTRREVRKEVRDPKSDWGRWRKHVERDEIGTMPVVKVEQRHVYAWLARLHDKGLSEQTIRNCRNILSTVMGEACQHGTIKRNPVVGIRMRKVAKKSAEDGWTYLVPEEQARLLNACDGPETWNLIAFAMGTGMRAGEMCALRWCDIDLSRGLAMVRFGAPGGQPTKTGRVRLVPLLGPARTAIDGEDDPCPTAPVFPTETGKFRDPTHPIKWETWKGILKAAGLTRRVRWHDLRHTCASSLVSGWWGRRWSLQEVRDLLGHTSIETTQRYAHLCPQALEEAARLTTGGRHGSMAVLGQRGGSDAEYSALPPHRLEALAADESGAPGSAGADAIPDARDGRQSECEHDAGGDASAAKGPGRQGIVGRSEALGMALGRQLVTDKTFAQLPAENEQYQRLRKPSVSGSNPEGGSIEKTSSNAQATDELAVSSVSSEDARIKRPHVCSECGRKFSEFDPCTACVARSSVRVLNTSEVGRDGRGPARTGAPTLWSPLEPGGAADVAVVAAALWSPLAASFVAGLLGARR